MVSTNELCFTTSIPGVLFACLDLVHCQPGESHPPGCELEAGDEGYGEGFEDEGHCGLLVCMVELEAVFEGVVIFAWGCRYVFWKPFLVGDAGYAFYISNCSQWLPNTMFFRRRLHALHTSA
jgi:hypothetical protein